jgi:hypothetical protein
MTPQRPGHHVRAEVPAARESGARRVNGEKLHVSDRTRLVHGPDQTG